MGLNKQLGNMYGFVSHTWNPIRGRCEHDCRYCYIKKMYDGKLFKKDCRLVEEELKTDLGKGNFIFIGSSTDMFGEWVDDGWIKKVLDHCSNFNHNRYLFQSKNTKVMRRYMRMYPDGSVLATTIETNRFRGLSKAPNVIERAMYLKELSDEGYEIMVTIEPILDFDLGQMVSLIEWIDPETVVIGADSKNCDLIEPCKDKIEKLINELRERCQIRIKDNLGRIIGK